MSDSKPANNPRRPADVRRCIILTRDIQTLVERYAKRNGVTTNVAANELLRQQFIEAQQ